MGSGLESSASVHRGRRVFREQRRRASMAFPNNIARPACVGFDHTGFPPIPVWSVNTHPGYAAGATRFVRVTLAYLNPASGYEVSFYKSSTGTSWILLDTIGTGLTGLLTTLGEALLIGRRHERYGPERRIRFYRRPCA